MDYLKFGVCLKKSTSLQRWLPVPMGFVVLLLSSTEGWSFPPCPTDRYASTWTNCIGTYPYASGGGYVGEWKNGQGHGQGTLTFADGRVQKGIWENDKLKPWWKLLW